jgi:hypothetical protein
VFNVGVAIATLIAFNTVQIFFLREDLWLPAESISTTSGPPFSGYALGRDGSDLVVLREDDRRVVILKESEVTRRQLCNLDGRADALSKRFVDQFGTDRKSQPEYAACPT